MKITKTQLTEMVREAVSEQLNEGWSDGDLFSMEIEVYVQDGKLEVSWTDSDGLEGWDPLEDFGDMLKQRVRSM